MQLRFETRKGGQELFAVLAGGAVDPARAADAVLEMLQQKGTAGLERGELLRGFEAANANPELARTGVLVARGTPPRAGMPAQLLPFFPIVETTVGEGIDPIEAYARNVVYPGDVILRKTPAVAGAPGRTVLGEPIPAPVGIDIPVLAGEGVLEEEDGRTYRAKTYGLVLFHGGRLQVVNALIVADDRMEARVTVFPDESRNDDAAQVAALVRALADLGVTHGIDREALTHAVQTARTQNRAVRGVVAARAQHAIDGREADFRIAIDLERKACKVEGDRIDYREMETVKNIAKGDVLAEKVDEQAPVPGFRVDGEVLKPLFHRSDGLKPGENTALSPDGKHVLADADGMVVLRAGKFHVVDQYVVAGDVDLSVGNIRASGSVRVRGQVKPGFLIRAGKDVDVADDVCKAIIEAGGEVRVHGAITTGSRVISGKNVSARFIQNSRVEADGDLDVQLSIAGSEVYVGGQIRAMGSQGTILGGEVNAALGVEARTIGAPSSRTRVVVGLNLKVNREIAALEKERSELVEELRNHQASLGKDFLADPRKALLALPPALRKGKLEVLQRMQELGKREAEVKARLCALAEVAGEVREATITVHGEIHAGTHVGIGGARANLAETLHHVVLYYHPEENRVVWRRI